MQTRRLKIAAITAFAGVFLVACEDIIVTIIDNTPPELGLMYASSPPARHPDGSQVTADNPIMPGGQFVIQPARARDTMNFIPVARDGQSAIRSQYATVTFSFKCTARVIGGWVEKDVVASIYGSQTTPDAAGAETKDTEGVVMPTTMNELWQRGGCETWGQIINVRQGTISNIRGVVRASATNNAQPSLAGTFEANFTNPSSYSISY